MNEEWRGIRDYLKYDVSDMGRVRNHQTNRILKQWSNGGYMYVHLRNEKGRKNFRVHRLVAEAFLGGIKKGMAVNHKNGIKHDNRAINLEWCTSSENTRHAMANGLFTPYKLPPHPHETRQVTIVETGEVFNSITECAKYIGGFATAICACLNGRVKTHLGYHFV